MCALLFRKTNPAASHYFTSKPGVLKPIEESNRAGHSSLSAQTQRKSSHANIFDIGNHRLLSLNLTRPFPMALGEGKCKGKGEILASGETRQKVPFYNPRNAEKYPLISQRKRKATLSKGCKSKTLMLVLLSFLSTAVFPAQPEYCLIIFLQVMLQGSLASWLKLTSDLFDTLGLCYRIVAFLHWRNHCAASRENRDSNGLFPSRNSAQ